MWSEKIGFIGVGHMAGALLAIIQANDLCPPERIYLSDIDSKKTMPYLAKRMNLAEIPDLINQCSCVFLTVKPQDLSAVLEQSKPASAHKLFVSPVAGVTTRYIKERLHKDAHVLRVMPNTPIQIGKGATAIAMPDNLPSQWVRMVQTLFSLGGEVAFIPEDKMDPIIGVNASSPAYFFRMIKAIQEEAVREGIQADVARRLAAKSMEGAAALILSSEFSLDAMIAQVASPGGTTERSLQEMDALHFDKVIAMTLRACAQRAYELGMGSDADRISNSKE